MRLLGLHRLWTGLGYLLVSDNTVLSGIGRGRESVTKILDLPRKYSSLDVAQILKVSEFLLHV